MTDQVQTRRGGSVVSFVVIGIVVTVILVGGIYILRKRSEGTTSAPIAVSQSPAPAASGNNGQTPAPTSSSQPSASNSPAPATSGQPQSDNLPHTGPSEDIASFFMLASMTGIIVAYTRSRRPYRYNR